jgi:hypothetical protein
LVDQILGRSAGYPRGTPWGFPIHNQPDFLIGRFRKQHLGLTNHLILEGNCGVTTIASLLGNFAQGKVQANLPGIILIFLDKSLLIIIILNFLVVLHQGLLSLLRQTYIHRQ